MIVGVGGGEMISAKGSETATAFYSLITLVGSAGENSCVVLLWEISSNDWVNKKQFHAAQVLQESAQRRRFQ